MGACDRAEAWPAPTGSGKCTIAANAMSDPVVSCTLTVSPALGQTVPARFLRCVLESRAMVSVTTADGDFPVVDGRVVAPDTAGLGIEPPMDVLGAPVATYES
jgi:hypothetical protein